jgi:glutamate synthase domain-containing protein 3
MIARALTEIRKIEKEVEELMGKHDKTTDSEVTDELLKKFPELQQKNPIEREKYEEMKKFVIRAKASFAGHM